ncbi:TniQ family protein [Paenibacillus phytohabitans]|uniref:TniQ family protein n=1 Tax=Paenibacillus phytohabitans TaxID=2654978 RepID=UPI001492F93F
MKFGIRLKPLEFESLTGYLERVSEKNGMPFLKLAEIVCKLKKYRNRDINSYELFSGLNINLDLTAKIVDLPKEVLNSMTMQPIYNLFRSYWSERSEGSFQMMLNTNKRFFCPICLAEGVTHLLLWQVDEIKMCNKHHIKLQDQCYCCSQTQPYMNLGKKTRRYCNVCEADLSIQDPGGKVSAAIVDEQLETYSNWIYLRGEQIKKTPAFLDDVSAYCSRLLYVIKNQETVHTQSKIEYLNPDIRVILRCLRTMREKDACTLHRILRILKQQNLSMEKFSNILVPLTYVQSLSNRLSPSKKNFGVCLAPWCTSYQSNEKMIAIVRTINMMIKKGTHFYDPAICLSCSLIYARSSEFVWTEMNDYILKGYKTVLPLIEDGHAPYAVYKQTGVDVDIIYKWLGYFANRKIMHKSMIDQYTPKFNDNKCLDDIKYINNMKKTNKSHLAKEYYGWSKREYYYFYADKKVMEYFALNIKPKKGNRPQRKSRQVKEQLEQYLESNTPITILKVTSALDISEGWLRSNNYIGLIREFQYKQRERSKIELYQKITEHIAKSRYSRGLYINKFLNSIGFDMVYIDKNYPEFRGWFKEQQAEHIRNYNKYIEKQLADQTEVIIKEFKDQGKTITNSALAKKLNVAIKTIKKNHYIMKLLGNHV